MWPFFWGVLGLGVGLVLGAIFGMYVHKYQIFPYNLAKKSFYLIHRSGPWSIGLYEGPDPFHLKPADGVDNPIITRNFVQDMEAVYTADPFLVYDGGKFYIFFEVMDREKRRGLIALAESSHGEKWKYRGVVLEEPFHLSYPHVFRVGEHFFMTPESGEDLSVRLYKGTPFPWRWEYVKTLISGYPFEDPTVFHHGGKWWLLTSLDKGRFLKIYFSEEITGYWREHPSSPVTSGGISLRPGGRVIFHEGRLFRIVQDHGNDYGAQVFLTEIVELSEAEYEERLALERPLLTRSGRGWNSKGVHHVDFCRLEDRWMAAVDGRSW